MTSTYQTGLKFDASLKLNFWCKKKRNASLGLFKNTFLNNFEFIFTYNTAFHTKYHFSKSKANKNKTDL